MKKTLSILLALITLFSVFTVAFSAEAAKKPGKVYIIEAYTTEYQVYTGIDWESKKGVSGYQVQFGNENIKSGKVKWKTKKYKIKGAKKHRFRIRTNAYKYNTARIRAYKKSGGKTYYGKWSRDVVVESNDG